MPGPLEASRVEQERYASRLAERGRRSPDALRLRSRGLVGSAEAQVGSEDPNWSRASAASAIPALSWCQSWSPFARRPTPEP
jgi:hypothetical protein